VAVVDGAVGGWGPTKYDTIEAQLLTKKGFLRFREFCITDYITENIDFWKRVKDYKDTFDPLHDNSPDGKAIYDEFVATTAPHQINIPGAILKRIPPWAKAVQQDKDTTLGHEIIGGKYLSDTFDEAFDEVFGQLKSDVFQRFKAEGN
jgi:hypothetical protein